MPHFDVNRVSGEPSSVHPWLVVAAALGMIVFVLGYNIAHAAEVRHVQDGDTFWITPSRETPACSNLRTDRLERIRLLDVDAPELRGICAGRAIAARERLRELLRAKPLRIERQGCDRLQKPRTLAKVYAGGLNVGAVLVREGLAIPYEPGRDDAWCAR